jgi:hypothetical protein
MQEELLSRRVLVFIDSQVYWICGYSYISEALNMSGKPLQIRSHPDRSLYHTLLKEQKTDFGDFSTLISYYLPRQLSFEGDILCAAQGMLRKFSMLSGVHCFEGLPPPLDRSLLFCNAYEPYSQPFSRREGFPSYSWTGWKNGKGYPNLFDFSISRDMEYDDRVVKFSATKLRCWIVWHCKLEDGSTYHINDMGRLRESSPPELEATKRNCRRRFRQIPTATGDFNFGEIPIPGYPLLIFWTICVHLGIKQKTQTENDSRGSLKYTAIGNDGAPCGYVQMDKAISEITIGIFAIVAAEDNGLWSLLLNRDNEIAERRGVVKLSSSALEKSLPPGPRWKAIALG